MSIIQVIKEKLKKYPQLPAKEGNNSLSVTPENGFTVWVTDHGNSYTVGFEGWHEEFSNFDEALNCFAWGLSSECRLMVIKRGSTVYKWVAQSLENGKWVNVSTTCLLFYPLWRRKNISYKQNTVLRI